MAFSRPHQRYCGTGIWSGRDKPTDWRAMESPARLCRPGRQASLAHPRGKPGFSTLSSGCGRETDCPLEGNGFELSVPRWLATAGAFFSAVSDGSSSRNSLCQFAEVDDCSDDTTAGRSAPTRTAPRNRCLSRAELKVRIHFPPAESLQTFRPDGPDWLHEIKLDGSVR